MESGVNWVPGCSKRRRGEQPCVMKHAQVQHTLYHSPSVSHKISPSPSILSASFRFSWISAHVFSPSSVASCACCAVCMSYTSVYTQTHTVYVCVSVSQRGNRLFDLQLRRRKNLSIYLWALLLSDKILQNKTASLTFVRLIVTELNMNFSWIKKKEWQILLRNIPNSLQVTAHPQITQNRHSNKPCRHRST